ncbi:MAG: YwbE family protein [Clostridia bacterium]|nr:YwbE family protein [Clostridia bacterium]
MNGQNRLDVKIGAKVKIVLKADQGTGRLTEGTVLKLLTKSSFHPHGIKVMLTDGQVGRVQEIIRSDKDTGNN